MKGGTRRAWAMGAAVLATLVLALLAPSSLRAQPIDMSHGGPITVTARDGMDWRQNDQEVVARGDAKAVRDNVTVTADVLIAHYRKKVNAQTAAAQAAPGGGAPAPPPPAKPAANGGATPPGVDDSGGNEIYRLEAVGHVHIYTATDQAWGDKGVYDMDQAVLILTGNHLKLTTPQDIVTARDAMEYYSQTRISIARGNAVVVTSDGRRIAADTLVSYSAPPDQAPPGQTTPDQKSSRPSGAAKPVPDKAPGAQAVDAGKPPAQGDDLAAASGKLKRVEAYGNVDIRTVTDTVYGDRGVYLPDTGKARILGHVRVTRGQNQVDGVAADIDMKTGVSTMLSSTDQRVHGLIVPNDATGDGGKAGDSGKDQKDKKKSKNEKPDTTPAASP